MCPHLAAVATIVGFVLFVSITKLVGFILPLASTLISCISLFHIAALTTIRIVATSHSTLSKIFPLLNFIQCVRTTSGVSTFRRRALLFSRWLGTNSNSDPLDMG